MLVWICQVFCQPTTIMDDMCSESAALMLLSLSHISIISISLCLCLCGPDVSECKCIRVYLGQAAAAAATLPMAVAAASCHSRQQLLYKNQWLPSSAEETLLSHLQCLNQLSPSPQGILWDFFLKINISRCISASDVYTDATSAFPGV